MRILKSTPIKNSTSSYSAGYTNNSSVTLVHGKHDNKDFFEKLHYHTKESEYFYVIRGQIKFQVDDKAVDIVENECLEAAPMEKHKILLLSDNTEYIVVRVNNPHDEKVILE